MDIDIDFSDRTIALNKLPHVIAARNLNVSHNTGIYVQNIPHNPITNMSTIDYKSAEKLGYFKIDFLNVHVYNGIKNNNHLLQLMETEPLWELLKNDEFVNLLFHLNGHADILKQTSPTSVEQLAAVLAMMRPAKRYLIGKDWTTIMNEIWINPDNNEYYFKKAHSIAYAHVIIIQMNLLCEQLLDLPN